MGGVWAGGREGREWQVGESLIWCLSVWNLVPGTRSLTRSDVVCVCVREGGREGGRERERKRERVSARDNVHVTYSAVYTVTAGNDCILLSAPHARV